MELWFTEQEKDQVRFGVRVDGVLFRGKSEFQEIEVLETAPYGRMLVLDGCVMTTDVDEFVYHECIAHVPACLHKNPKKALVVGGGDGGTVRELLKHKGIGEIVLCEIDGMVVEACRKYFPAIACGLDDKRVKVEIGDGVAYVKEHEKAFDIIIIDSTDPIGPGEGLFSGEFYKSVARALKPGGLMVAQSEAIWFGDDVLGRIHRNISAGFAHKKTYLGAIPTYPRGVWSWTMASAEPIDPKNFDRERFGQVAAGLKYLTQDSMVSVFDLPPFFRAKFAKND